MAIDTGSMRNSIYSIFGILSASLANHGIDAVPVESMYRTKNQDAQARLVFVAEVIDCEWAWKPWRLACGAASAASGSTMGGPR
jgi:hypothetical protein